MDRASVFSLSVLPPDPDVPDDSRALTQQKFVNFINTFRLDNAFIYRFALLIEGVCRPIGLTTFIQRSTTGKHTYEIILP